MNTHVSKNGHEYSVYRCQDGTWRAWGDLHTEIKVRGLSSKREAIDAIEEEFEELKNA